MPRHLLLGTAGHIDHGKTALIKALTGVDTDRLPEEKRRGMTLDLGFAALELDDLTVGIVDVPGHERLLKNMLAGATGIDMALLVVAADESVRPQTREHFEALRFLSLSTGVIAVTKCDLVDENWMELVEQEIGELVTGSFLENAPLVRVSAQTGAGLDDLRATLRSAADRVSTPGSRGPFRLAVDRSFSSPGHGAVVTGSVASGQASVGDALQLMPQGLAVNVRSLESHSQPVQAVERGQRAALNLSGVHYRDIERGQTLATPGSLLASRLVTLAVETSSLADREIKSRMQVRLYVGTAEHVGRLRLLEKTELNPGESSFGQLQLFAPACVVWGQSFVMRALSASALLGGGRIVDPLAYRIKTSDERRLRAVNDLATGDEAQRVAAVALLAGFHDWQAAELPQRAGVDDVDSLIEQLTSRQVLQAHPCEGRKRVIHREVAAQIEARLVVCLAAEHELAPLAPSVPLGRLRKHFSTLQPAKLLDVIAGQLALKGRLKLAHNYAALTDWRPQLTARQAEMLKEMVSSCQQAGLTPPSLGEFAERFGVAADEVDALLRVAADGGQLVCLPDKDSRDANAAQRARIFLHRQAESELMERVYRALENSAEWTVSEFREGLGISRKYAIPLCEHLDRLGLTQRQGDRRQLIPQTPSKT